jgi:hypothetical protein
VTHGVSLQTALNLDPFMIHETFLCLTETAFGSHPCRVVSVTYRKLRPFHGGNTGSNPVGDANLSIIGGSAWRPKRAICVPADPPSPDLAISIHLNMNSLTLCKRMPSMRHLFWLLARISR